MAIKIKCRRTILLGLGGTGVRALVHIKRAFLKNFGELPPTLRLVGFDTTINKESLKLEDQNIMLSGAEFLHLTVANPREVVERTPEIANWFPPANMQGLTNIVRGATRRTNGRLALFANAAIVYERLKEAHKHVSAINNQNFVTRSPRFELSDDPVTYIFIICSLAGGTGSGMFLDIGYFCRKIWGDTDHRIFGIFLLPGIFSGKPGTKLVEGNGYAALKELDYWMDQATSVAVRYPSLDLIGWGGETNKPFDYICLMDDEDEKGGKVITVDEMLSFVASSIFLYMTVDLVSREGQVQDFWINLENILGQMTPWEKKKPKYMGFGMSSLEIPVEDILNQTIAECVLNLIENDWVPQDREFNGRAYAGDVVRDQGLKGEALMEAIIPSSYAPAALPVEAIEDKPWTKSPHVITQWREEAVRKLKYDFQTRASQDSPQYQSLLRSKVQIIKQEVNKLLHDKGGIGNAKLFLQTLINNLRGDRADLEKKAQEVRHKLSEWDRAYQDLEEKEVKPAFARTFRKTAVGAAIQKVYGRIEQHKDLLRDEARLQVGINLLATLTTQVEEYLSNVHELEERLVGEVAYRVRGQLRRPGERLVEDPFTRYLREGFLDPRVNERKPLITVRLLSDAWVRRMHESKDVEASGEGTSLLELVRLPTDEISKWLVDTVRDQFKDIQELTIEDIISDVLAQDRQRANEAIQQFIKRALPMWGPISIPPQKQLEVEELLIFGIPGNPNESVLRRHIDQSREITTQGEQGSRVSTAFTTMWEPHAIRALRLKVPVPLHVIRNLQAYRARYLQLEDDPQAKPEERLTHHIHKDWRGSTGLPDLFPYEVGP